VTIASITELNTDATTQGASSGELGFTKSGKASENQQKALKKGKRKSKNE
jgi:hypothetical protein